MNPGTIKKIEAIVDYMELAGWAKLVDNISIVSHKFDNTWNSAIRSAYSNLLSEHINIAELKYKSYLRLLENVENPELNQLIIEDKQKLAEAESKTTEMSEQFKVLIQKFTDKIIEEAIEFSNLSNEGQGINKQSA